MRTFQTFRSQDLEVVKGCEIESATASSIEEAVMAARRRWAPRPMAVRVPKQREQLRNLGWDYVVWIGVDCRLRIFEILISSRMSLFFFDLESHILPRSDLIRDERFTALGLVDQFWMGFWLICLINLKVVHAFLSIFHSGKDWNRVPHTPQFH